MRKIKNISLTGKAVILIAVLIVFFLLVKKSKNDTNLGAVKKRKRSASKCQEAFSVLKQIHSALVDKSKLTIVETAWFNTIGKLINE